MSYLPFRILGNGEPEPEPRGPRTDSDFRDWCYLHNRAEPLREGDFRLCGECGHVWRTREDFLADVEAGCREAGVPMDPDQPFCPLCTHEF